MSGYSLDQAINRIYGLSTDQKTLLKILAKMWNSLSNDEFAHKMHHLIEARLFTERQVKDIIAKLYE